MLLAVSNDVVSPEPVRWPGFNQARNTKDPKFPAGSASRTLAGTVKLPDGAGAQHVAAAPVFWSIALLTSRATNEPGWPPDHVTVRPLERVTEMGFGPFCCGLVSAGSVGRMIDEL